MSDTVLAPRTDDLAERLRAIGISKPYASQLASGARTPSLQMAVKIERELGIKPSDWLDHPAQVSS